MRLRHIRAEKVRGHPSAANIRLPAATLYSVGSSLLERYFSNTAVTGPFQSTRGLKREFNLEQRLGCLRLGPKQKVFRLFGHIFHLATVLFFFPHSPGTKNNVFY